MTGMDLHQKWLHGLKTSHVAHIRASAYYTLVNRVLGLSTSLLATVVATNFFSRLSNLAQTDPRLDFAVGILSVMVPVLSAAMAYLKPAELAEQHRSASVGYGELRRLLEIALLSNPDEKALAEYLGTIREKWSDLDRKAPLITQRMWDSVSTVFNKPEKK